jgi:molybdate transport system substrate-binding protein
LKKLMLIAALIMVSTTFAAFAGGCGEKTPVNLNIAIAASLTGAMTEIDALYVEDNPDVTVTPIFAASGTLQQQIEEGATVDVFISAAAKQMNALSGEGLIVEDTRKDLLNNKIVLIVPNDSTLDITSFNDLATDKVHQIALGDPQYVPAGTYGQQAFDELGITDQVQPKLVLGTDVKAVLAYVESGNVDAGIVYSTDAYTSDKVKIVAEAPQAINAKIVYPVAVIKASASQDAAKKFIDFLFTDKAAAVFEKYGFSLVGE